MYQAAQAAIGGIFWNAVWDGCKWAYDQVEEARVETLRCMEWELQQQKEADEAADNALQQAVLPEMKNAVDQYLNQIANYVASHPKPDDPNPNTRIMGVAVCGTTCTTLPRADKLAIGFVPFSPSSLLHFGSVN